MLQTQPCAGKGTIFLEYFRSILPREKTVGVSIAIHLSVSGRWIVLKHYKNSLRFAIDD
jgi:hypothetical protein